jgi:hypothetical protein
MISDMSSEYLDVDCHGNKVSLTSMANGWVISNDMI